MIANVTEMIDVTIFGVYAKIMPDQVDRVNIDRLTWKIAFCIVLAREVRIDFHRPTSGGRFLLRTPGQRGIRSKHGH